MQTWQSDIKKGVRHLSHHQPDKALGFFCKALERCPVAQSRSLSRLLFYLGVTLRRLGCVDSAVKSWLLSYKLTKDSFSLKMIQRYANTYGMAKQADEERDDWRAFFSLQLSRYLVTKKHRRFSCDAERDMVRDLIYDHWRQLKKRHLLSGRSPEEKEKLFQSVKIVFPFVVVPDQLIHPVVHVDFRHSRKVELHDRCPCGSGLSFMACCGRIPGERELLSGIY